MGLISGGPATKKEFSLKIDLASTKKDMQQQQAKNAKFHEDTELDCEFQELNWKQFVYAMNSSPIIAEQVEREVKAFADAVLNIDSYLKPEV